MASSSSSGNNLGAAEEPEPEPGPPSGPFAAAAAAPYDPREYQPPHPDDRGGGRLGLCFCPGKQIVKSRLRAGHEESGRPIMRDLTQDLQRLRGMGIRQCETSQPRAVLDCSTRRTP